MKFVKAPKLRIAARLLLLATLIGGGAIVDGAAARYYFYSNWIRLQTAADAAAVAGANYLPANPARALAVAREYAELNGVRASEIVAERVSRNDREISLRVTRTVPFYLAGAPTRAINARASATLQPQAPGHSGAQA